VETIADFFNGIGQKQSSIQASNQQQKIHKVRFENLAIYQQFSACLVITLQLMVFCLDFLLSRPTNVLKASSHSKNKNKRNPPDVQISVYSTRLRSCVKHNERGHGGRSGNYQIFACGR
jgi:hypothetical protein